MGKVLAARAPGSSELEPERPTPAASAPQAHSKARMPRLYHFALFRLGNSRLDRLTGPGCPPTLQLHCLQRLAEVATSTARSWLVTHAVAVVQCTIWACQGLETAQHSAPARSDGSRGISRSNLPPCCMLDSGHHAIGCLPLFVRPSGARMPTTALPHPVLPEKRDSPKARIVNRLRLLCAGLVAWGFALVCLPRCWRPEPRLLPCVSSPRPPLRSRLPWMRQQRTRC